jgi:transcriptional regulator with GAF, ATPase, and Fis domain
VQVRVCAATHKDLRVLAEEGNFRADLYFRIGMPQIAVPTLRERREEIPFLIAHTVQSVSPALAVVANVPLPAAAPTPVEPPSRAQVLAALLTADCNMTAAARVFNLHRTQLRRLITRYHIDVDQLHVAVKSPGRKKV